MSVNIEQLGQKDVEELAREPSTEDAKPSDASELAVKILKMKKVMKDNDGSPYSKIIENEIAYFDAAASMLVDDEDLKRIYGFDFKGVEKLAEVLKAHVETEKAKETLMKKGKAHIDKLSKYKKTGAYA